MRGDNEWSKDLLLMESKVRKRLDEKGFAPPSVAGRTRTRFFNAPFVNQTRLRKMSVTSYRPTGAREQRSLARHAGTIQPC